MPAPDDKRLSALEKILQISRDMVATVDLDELLGVIIQRSMELLEAERATIFLYDAETDELVSRVAAGSEEIRFAAGVGVAGAAARSREILNIHDAYADDRFNREVDLRTGFRTRNILAVPLLDYSRRLVGVMEVLNKRSGPFVPADIALARTLAAQAGVALQRARLLEHYVQKQRMEHALQIARQIQQGLLPRESPRPPGFEVAGWSAPADETGGDIYDFFDLGGGRWTLMLADASGHGIGPALVVAEARAMLRALSVQDHPPDQQPADPRGQMDISSVLAKVNNLLVADLGEARFVTCFFALLDAPAAEVRYASAGQGPILFYDRSADAFQESNATDLPLGILEGTDFAQQVRRPLGPGDVLAIATDGFFEACDPAGEQFGTERICRVLRDSRDLPAADMIESLRLAVEQFTRSAPQADDLTAIIVKGTARA
jgi:sigma-B regulation protein RsbU (phosphoserine phosphatase)